MDTVAQRPLFLPTLGILLVPLCGCGSSGPDMHPVQGVVSYQGKPLPLGRVSFVPNGYRPSSALIDAHGRYKLEAPAGEHRIEVVANAYRSADKSKPSIDVNFGETQPLVPAKYNRYQSSGIIVTVEAKPVNQIDLHLK